MTQRHTDAELRELLVEDTTPHIRARVSPATLRSIVTELIELRAERARGNLVPGALSGHVLQAWTCYCGQLNPTIRNCIACGRGPGDK
jgi:hypothetical protein